MTSVTLNGPLWGLCEARPRRGPWKRHLAAASLLLDLLGGQDLTPLVRAGYKSNTGVAYPQTTGLALHATMQTSALDGQERARVESPPLTRRLSAVERTTSTRTGTPSASNNGLGAAHDRCGILSRRPMHAWHAWRSAGRMVA